jgi:hypothetical protein
VNSLGHPLKEVAWQFLQKRYTGDENMNLYMILFLYRETKRCIYMSSKSKLNKNFEKHEKILYR